MKSRISSTIWMLVIFNGIATLVALSLAYNSGRQSAANNTTGFDASGLIIPGVIALKSGAEDCFVRMSSAATLTSIAEERKTGRCKSGNC